MKGFLITFEGIDGSGKSTQAQLLHTYLTSLGRNVQLFREPGSTDVGERIRSILLDNANAEMDPRTELFLYLAARAQITSRVVVPALQGGSDVILDRFMDSTTAYQGYARDLGVDEMIRLNLIATDGIVPDITFVIDCDPIIALSRVKGKPDRLESEGLDFMRKVREGFLKLSEIDRKRIVVIDGNREIHVIEREIQLRVNRLIRDQTC
jgi:dTMP kinase